jgi:uncharacterized membrane protein YecN with MAPEG domain
MRTRPQVLNSSVYCARFVFPITPPMNKIIHLVMGSTLRGQGQHKVGLGGGGHDDLERAIRAQGNFAEYVPFGIILIICLELNGAPWWLVSILGIALIMQALCCTSIWDFSMSGRCRK